MLKKLLCVCIGAFCVNAFVQSQSSPTYRFTELDYAVGRNIPFYSAFPPNRHPHQISISIGKVQADSVARWKSYYGFPATGLSFTSTDYGNKEVFGYSYSLIPFVAFRMHKSLHRTLQFKIGMGASYFTRYYNRVSNNLNWAIGSPFAISFTSRITYNFSLVDRLSCSVGGSYFHSSNSHTQLPNFGQNSFLVNTSVALLGKHTKDLGPIENIPYRENKSRDYYMSIYTGSGMHELGNTSGPKGGPKYQVFSLGLFGSVVFNKSFRLKLGTTYRLYESYLHYIEEHAIEPHNQNPIASASNVFISVGGELLLGHVGAEGEVGINIYKPFYEEFNNQFEGGKKTYAHKLRSKFPMRLGLKAYAISTAKVPTNNFFIASHVNANFGEADHLSFTLGYVRKM